MITPSGKEIRWPHTVPTAEEQAVRNWLIGLATHTVLALVAFGLLVRLPPVPKLAYPAGVVGLLTLVTGTWVICSDPYVGDALGVAFFYYGCVIVALLGGSLVVPYLTYWRGQASLSVSFGMAFVGAFIALLSGLIVLPLLELIGASGAFVWQVYPLIGLLLAILKATSGNAANS